MGLVCLIGSTYAVLTASNNHEHEATNVHPPGIDPIKPVPGRENRDAQKLEDNKPLTIDSKGGGGEIGKVTVDKTSEPKIAASPVPTAEPQKVGETSKAVEGEVKKDETATTGTKERGTEKEVRKEPPVPDAPDSKKSPVTQQPVKPDARVLMSQNDSDEKEKEKEKEKEIVKGVVTSAPHNSTETGAKVVEQKESKSESEVKRIKKRDISDTSSSEAAVVESPEKEKPKTESQVASVTTPANNDTLSTTKENDPNIRKPARDLKSNKENEKEHKYTGEDKERGQNQQIKAKPVSYLKDVTGFSTKGRRLLERNSLRTGLRIKN